MTKRVMRVPVPFHPLVTTGKIALSDSEKAEAFADSLEAQFQPLTVPLSPAVVEMVNVAFMSNFLNPTNAPN
jgi:hypothetical protein